MACLILESDRFTCFADSVTEVAFGPLFDSVEDAEAFQEWIGVDPRRWTTHQLCGLKAQWAKSREFDPIYMGA